MDMIPRKAMKEYRALKPITFLPIDDLPSKYGVYDSRRAIKRKEDEMGGMGGQECQESRVKMVKAKQ
ncbi:hypothetical protein Dda_5998 [Drechslerella dactyloides]|uniref:Uncharacterized protein n=1 Tax=Drechslerella dactyloides TaxID=74499 RepID=A0AAD6IVB7_DREDA|nr:hypothetical protein Dda_5998 [Drechslerella dactyloides]